MTPDDWASEKQAYEAYIGALNEAGVFIETDWLLPVDTATTVSLKGGTKIVQDGPFAEMKETLGGYFARFAYAFDVANCAGSRGQRYCQNICAVANNNGSKAGSGKAKDS
ncbi:hypothetical protein [Lentilitoribacter sp. Alg239-R112]|uniref:YciI family protein n=1 Tax=Lentilitoribacter sp. Alg239-R112 TaxID=2305987 RepID=UPI0013A6F534|nr:hypothetical protein [Lentilitoribacter sp. Alg239-R112]